VSPLRLVTGWVYSTSAWPRSGGVSFLPARIGVSGGAVAGGVACASAVAAARLAPTSVAANTERARVINPLLRITVQRPRGLRPRLYTLHLPVPVFGLGVDGSEDFHVPLTAAPRFDDLGGDHIDQQLREQPSLRVALEVVCRVFPREVGIQHQREEQIVPVVDD